MRSYFDGEGTFPVASLFTPDCTRIILIVPFPSSTRLQRKSQQSSPRPNIFVRSQVPPRATCSGINCACAAANPARAADWRQPLQRET